MRLAALVVVLLHHHDALAASAPSFKARREAQKGSWAGARVAVLWRGMHYGSYASARHRGKIMKVDGNHESVHANHDAKVLAPLARAGANVTVFACTHRSDVTAAWLARARVAFHDVVEPLPGVDKKILPNELLKRAYALVGARDWDVLVSMRADLWLKRDVVTLLDGWAPTPTNDRIRLPFREVFLKQSPKCQFRERAPSPRCLHSWAKAKSRFSDAVLVMPRRALADVEFALDELLRHGVWDQHTLAWELAKGRGWDVDGNVSALVEGFWDSNVDRHANPLFGLARGTKFLAQLKEHDARGA